MTALAAYGAEYQLSDWRESHPFAGYAARYWPAHARRGRSSIIAEQESLEAAEIALLESPEYTEQWLRIHDTASSDIRRSLAPKRAGWMATHNALYHAAFHGLSSEARTLCDRHAALSPAVFVRMASEALQAACFRGHVAIAETLLSHGAAPLGAVGPFENAIVAAAAGGSLSVLSMLFARGATFSPRARGASSAGGRRRLRACFRRLLYHREPRPARASGARLRAGGDLVSIHGSGGI